MSTDVTDREESKREIKIYKSEQQEDRNICIKQVILKFRKRGKTEDFYIQ